MSWIKSCRNCNTGIGYTLIMLIKHTKIRVSFLVSGLIDGGDNINSHGTSFSIKKENLDLLFNNVR